MQAITINQSSLVITPVMDSKTANLMSQNSLDNLIRNDNYNGYISKPTIKRIERMVENLVYSIKEFRLKNLKVKNSSSVRPVFITLTLPYEQFHCDKIIKRECLMRFIELLKKVHGVSNYIWRAEPQENGNIHFHIIIDKYVHWNWINIAWNYYLSKLEYLDAFEQKHGHRDANTSDTHGLRKVDNVSAYICKYMVKNEKNRKIKGRIWGASANFKKMKNPRVELCNFLIAELMELKGLGLVYTQIYDYCTVLRFKRKLFQKTSKNLLLNIFDDFIHSFIQFKFT